MGFWSDLFGGKDKDKEPEGSVGSVHQGAGGPGGMTGGEAFQSGIISAEERREQLLADALAAQQSGQDYSYNTDEFTGHNLGLGNEETVGKLREGMTGAEYAKFMQTLHGNNPGAMRNAFPFSSGNVVGNLIKPLVSAAIPFGSGIMNLVPSLLSNTNKALSGIFSNEKAPTDMGTKMSSIDQADADAASVDMADISGPSTDDGTYATEAEAIKAYNEMNSNFPPIVNNAGITHPDLMQANSLFNFSDMFEIAEDGSIKAKDIARSFNDNQGFDIDLQNQLLEYNKPLWGGNLNLSANPDNLGITFNKSWGA